MSPEIREEPNTYKASPRQEGVIGPDKPRGCLRKWKERRQAWSDLVSAMGAGMQPAPNHLRRRSMVFTTNKHPQQWGAVLHDEDLAAAIVDRVLERGRLLQLDGPPCAPSTFSLTKPTLRITKSNRTEYPEIHRRSFRNPHSI